MGRVCFDCGETIPNDADVPPFGPDRHFICPPTREERYKRNEKGETEFGLIMFALAAIAICYTAFWLLGWVNR